MTACERTRANLFPYIDRELHGLELKDFEAHLETCLSCQDALDARNRFCENLRSVPPPPAAPAELRQRIQRSLDLSSARQATCDTGLMARLTAALRALRRTSPQLAFALAMLMAVLGIARVAKVARAPHSGFAMAASDFHQHRLQHHTPLGIHSSSPEAVSAWFQGKIPVRVTLPSTADLPEESQPYRIEGAGVLPFQGIQLGYVAYRVGDQPVTLVIAPASAVSLSGRKQVPMKALIIHYDSDRGYHVVTWAVAKKHVTYSLVSNSRMHPNAACIVCHAAPKDHAFMESLLRQ